MKIPGKSFLRVLILKRAAAALLSVIKLDHSLSSKFVQPKILRTIASAHRKVSTFLFPIVKMRTSSSSQNGLRPVW